MPLPHLSDHRKGLLLTAVGGLALSMDIPLVRLIAQWPRQVEAAAAAHEPHRVAFYLYDLAAQFHQLWTQGKDEASLRFVVAEDRALTLARLALVRAVGFVIASGLRLIGVEPAESM